MKELKTILVVDDETHILHVVSLKLRNAGYEVITAEDGEEGLAKAQVHMPDLLITDYQMPFMTGLELCIKLCEHEKTKEIPALMLTARGFSLANEYLEQTNIEGVLTKPFSPREVLARVDEIMNRSQMMEARKAS
ncbi:Alkaline phosphatase synthesis transcriptional regulatory protein PhoP [Poriferisphaera corsica]|uniref:Alkaline phosphatase synthesis transcriptional regulatory protein PhoP n=1 Tax=Poriferisphaera corsica TaxID=2528020 RepID=A0A517YYA0_9BACT|nr:response regulator [Poriferisphaera corsica]QDU35196.1 Alkaline phosphatase synthesis transcriptional regulatory protein PhoP [Poriferisphaera corsica]